MPVRFHGPSGVQELIPAPLVDIRKSFIRGTDNEISRPEYLITLNGTIVNVGNDLLNSPGASGYAFGDMKGILAEQSRIRELFSQDGGLLEIESPTGSGNANINAYCLIDGIDFNNSTWTTKCEYIVNLRTYDLSGEDTAEPIQSYSETWNVAEQTDGTYVLGHNLQASAIKIYSASGTVNNPLSDAKSWCEDRSYAITSGVLSSGISTFGLHQLISNVSVPNNFWNYSIVENIGVDENSWQLSETFLYYPSGNCREEIAVTFNYEENNPNKITLNLNGSLIGYADRDSNFNSKTSAAYTKWGTVEGNLYTRAITYAPSGFTVFPNPIQKQVTREITAGILRYNYTYVCASGSLIDNAIDENVSIIDTSPTDIFAQIAVPGRANGPVVQYMGTSTLPERTVNISATISRNNAILTPSTILSLYLNKPNTNDIVNALKPGSGYYYLRQDSEEWNPVRGTYSRSTGWTLHPEGAAVSGIPSGILTNRYQ